MSILDKQILNSLMMKHTHQFLIAIALSFATATAAAESIRGAFGFELSTNIANYEIASSCGTSIALNGMNEDEADHFRIFQMMEPRRYYLCVKFENMPIGDILDNNGILSVYEEWIASIKAKSKSFDALEECESEYSTG